MEIRLDGRGALITGVGHRERAAGGRFGIGNKVFPISRARKLARTAHNPRPNAAAPHLAIEARLTRKSCRQPLAV